VEDMGGTTSVEFERVLVVGDDDDDDDMVMMNLVHSSFIS
jgi:hypothetical protein